MLDLTFIDASLYQHIKYHLTTHFIGQHIRGGIAIFFRDARAFYQHIYVFAKSLPSHNLRWDYSWQNACTWNALPTHADVLVNGLPSYKLRGLFYYQKLKFPKK